MATQLHAPRPILESRSTCWFIAALILLLFALTNLPWTLDDRDQAKQAFTSFEMVTEGHWLYQRTPNDKVATKPPLVGWVSAGIYGVTRSWELAWRLPSFAAAIALLVLLGRNADHVYGATAGLLAMSACGLNLFSPRLATLVRTDMPLALVVFLLGVKIWEMVRSGVVWRRRDRVVMFALLTAAMLIKGPIVYAFLLPGIVAFEIWRRLGPRSTVSPWPGWWPVLASSSVFLAWVAAGNAWVPGFYEEVILKEFLGRFGETVHRSQPIYFYLLHLLHKLTPWSFLLIGFGVAAWRGRDRAVSSSWRHFSPGTAWLICWSVGGIVLMSLVPSKRVDRIFPVVPPLCLLLGAQVAHLSRREDLVRRVQAWSGIAVAFACIFTGVYAAQRMVRSARADDGAWARFGEAVCREAAAGQWRYELVGGLDDGPLVYLRRNHFLTPDKAIDRWRGGELDALVVPAEEVPRLLRELDRAIPAGLEATRNVNGKPRSYVLLKRN